jgi:hypothetical protein
MGITFSIVAKDGRTPVSDPRWEAYHYMGLLQSQGRTTSLTVEGMTWKVESPGLMTLIFVPLEN